jgi:hypothetical protein
LEESGDEEGPEGGEKERGRESRPEIHVFWPDLSLYSGHKSGRAWVSAGSDQICPTDARTPAYVRQIRPDPIENHREIPTRVPFQPTVQMLSRVPFLPTVQMSSTSVFNRWPERGRRTKRALRERWVFSEKNKEERRGRKKQQEKEKNGVF